MHARAILKGATTDQTTAAKSLKGFYVRETAGAAARITIRETGAAGSIIFDIPLTANEGVGDMFPEAIVFDDVIHVEVESGAVRYSIFGG